MQGEGLMLGPEVTDDWFDAWWEKQAYGYDNWGVQYKIAREAWFEAKEAERVRCAVICDGMAKKFEAMAANPLATETGKLVNQSVAFGAINCANMIRQPKKRVGMKVELVKSRGTGIDDFAEEHDLTMVVQERWSSGQNDGRQPNMRVYAHFRGAEVKRGRMLLGEHGNGANPEQAIAEYAKLISGKMLVIDAMSSTRRREIAVPMLATDRR